jgi:hypothetical protein
MTLRYAKVASRTVADEYFAVSEQVEALYGQPAQLPADAAGPKMTRLRREHHRLLGNGYCTRPPQLDCAFEPICETCSYFQTSIEFRPILTAQHNHAAAHPQTSPPGTLRPAHQPDRRHPGINISLTTITRIMPLCAHSLVPAGIPLIEDGVPAFLDGGGQQMHDHPDRGDSSSSSCCGARRFTCRRV